MQGVVERVATRGKATNVQIGGDWYGCGFDGIPFKEGDKIEFDYTMDKTGRYKNLDVSSAKVLEKGAAAPSPARNSGGGGSYDSRQACISFQSARNAAIETVKLAIDAGAVALPAAKAAKYDALLAVIDEVTTKYYNDTDHVSRTGENPLSDNNNTTEDELDA